ncbi:hypothetical protein F5Y11DRAFT_56590 [Daldinia sp. FL1419]|nr:hypothetical protein F5Y11DRAFT_56590 [Daldinia sp. FL1419]
MGPSSVLRLPFVFPIITVVPSTIRSRHPVDGTPRYKLRTPPKVKRQGGVMRLLDVEELGAIKSNSSIIASRNNATLSNQTGEPMVLSSLPCQILV